MGHSEWQLARTLLDKCAGRSEARWSRRKGLRDLRPGMRAKFLSGINRLSPPTWDDPLHFGGVELPGFALALTSPTASGVLTWERCESWRRRAHETPACLCRLP